MRDLKGIILAGGEGTRLYPLTKTISKQLLPVYDKPMIYYPLSVLMIAGIKDIMIICDDSNLQNFQKLLGSGESYGIKLSYKVQKKPEGIPDAFKISKEFIGNSSICLILGDNIFYGQNLQTKINQAINSEKSCSIFTYQVSDPQNYGIVQLDNHRNIISIKEKPKESNSNLAITGLYFFDNSVIEKSFELAKSSRDELEITDLIKLYSYQDNLNIIPFGRGFAWLDTGNHNSLLSAGQFVETIEKRQGLKIACIEEIALRKTWISVSDLESTIKKSKKNDYISYLEKIITEFK